MMPKKICTDFEICHKDVNETLEYVEENKLMFDDEEMERIERFKLLEVYQQDLLMLHSQGYSLREIGAKLDVSYNWVRERLNEINKILKG